MVEFWRRILKGLLILCIGCAMFLAGTGIARAQFEPRDSDIIIDNPHPNFWMSDPRFKQRNSTMGCCGEHDCKAAIEVGAKIQETDDGFYVVDPRATKKEPEFFSKQEHRQNGLYFTEDEDNRAFVCVYGGKVVCVAIPRKGTF